MFLISNNFFQMKTASESMAQRQRIRLQIEGLGVQIPLGSCNFCIFVQFALTILTSIGFLALSILNRDLHI